MAIEVLGKAIDLQMEVMIPRLRENLVEQLDQEWPSATFTESPAGVLITFGEVTRLIAWKPFDNAEMQSFA